MKKLLPLAVPALFAGIVVFPLLLLFGGSFMGAREAGERLAPVLSNASGFASWPPIPQYPTLRPYVELLLDTPAFFVMFWNSAAIALGTLLGQLAVGAPAAWGFAKGRFPCRNALFTVYIVLMLMPFQVTMVSNYLVLDRLALLDTRAAIILPAAFSTFPVFIMYRFFRSIPNAVVESASLDGANQLQIFLHMGLPLGSAGVMSALVLGFLECWSLVEQPLAFLRDRTRWPLSLFLANITAGQAGLALAASVVTLIPALLVFLYGQDWLEQGIVAASLKE